MKLNQLRDIVAVAERGSLRAAARHLELAQPALTRSVRDLERELGAPLFERRARGMVLTPMGAAFVRRANAVLSEVRRAREEFEQLHGGTRGEVVAGLSMVALIALLPKALSLFRTRYPNVQLHLIEGWYPTLENALKDGSMDFYVGPEPVQPPPSDLVQELLFENVRIVLGRKGHPLGDARSLSQLIEAEWATTSVTFKAEEEFSELFTRFDLPAPKLALRSQSALTLMASLAASDLLAMVPIQWIQSPWIGDQLARIPVRETLRAPSIVTIRRAGLPLTPAAEYLLDLMRRNVPGAVKQARKERATKVR
ncbi:LysR substrate-binding domain-containing protein [Undibacter mobilis]|uniref:LysR family transcriptional regulator n=1 Tax=Undibacter mobilis TaxID=2292256 RepID=A0A371B814_9BRAD|nr:LysR substrate-binding domain-containing protein [Undibacter mobilis]RDV03573.1 LysR family transcriptional regulator [Undibacter mobilis]